MDYLIKKKNIIIRSILVFLFFWYSAYLQYIPIILLKLDIKNLSTEIEVMLSIFSSLVVFLVLLLIYHKELKKEFIIFKNNLLENLDIGLRYWILGLFVMVGSNIILNFVFHAGGANNENLVQDMIHTLPYLMIVEAGFIAPFNEEIVFRKTLKDIFKNKWIFIIFSFLLFGGAHVLNNASNFLDYCFIIPYGALGASFAFMYWESDSIFTSMFFHILHNFSLVMISIFFL